MVKLQSKAYKTTQAAEQAKLDFHGASVINEEGEEIPITETMVQRACKAFIKQWEAAQKKQRNN